MNLVNTLPIPAAVKMAPAGEHGEHHVLVVAKATFHLADRQTSLERERPLGFFEVDEDTKLGTLPSDSVPRLDGRFEVFVLGQAHAPAGRSVTQQTIAVTVGDVTRTMCIFGDRVWEQTATGLRASAPTPYQAMPLIWERAFGGRCEVWLDPESPLEVAHPLNARGRGFDAGAYAAALAKELRLPVGWPQIRQERLLPNLEHPDYLIESPADDPEPFCWAAIPVGIGMTQGHVSRGHATVMTLAGLRSHPDWVISRPRAGARVEMVGLHREGTIRSALPLIRLFVDHEEVDGVSQRELIPYRLFLLPEEHRLVLSFHTFFRRSAARTPRTLRLRAEQGPWLREVGTDISEGHT